MTDVATDVVDPRFAAFTAAARDAVLIRVAQRDVEALADRWDDEAVAATLAGNPRRAGYLEDLVRRLRTALP